MATLYRTLTYTTGSIGPGASTSRNDTINSNVCDIVKISVVPSSVSAGQLTTYSIYKHNTFLAADLVYSTTSFAGSLVDPIETDGVTSTERNEGFIAKYEDLDSLSQLHNKITNNALVSRTFTVTITYVVLDPYVRDVLSFAGTEVGAKITAAITDLPSTGGVVDCRGLEGAQSMSTKVSITKANVTLLFSPSLTLTLSGVAAVQSPFGSNFYVTANNVWFVCQGGRAIFKAAAGSQSAMITFKNAVGGGVDGLELDGNKANNSAISDDAFQTGVDFISDSNSGATAFSRITVRNCDIHDHIHYGVVPFGNLCSGNVIVNNLIHDNGKVGDALSTGDAIFPNTGSGYNHIEGNFCYNNKRSGIHLLAGSDGVGTPYTSAYNKIINNWLYNNTLHGVFLHEEGGYGSVVGSTQLFNQVSGNHCFSNGGHGLYAVVADVGVIQNTSFDNNVSYLNTGYGLLIQSVDATNKVSQTKIEGNHIKTNTAGDVFLGSFTLDTLCAGNYILGTFADNATHTLRYGNKENITDASFALHASPLTWEEAGVRTWSVFPTSGTLAITSGDGAGRFNVSLTGGITSGGPIIPASVTYASRPSSPLNGMIIAITDSTTNTWGATVAGGGANQVLAWYNSGTSVWTVIGN